jgi:Uma2 family endonuclease
LEQMTAVAASQGLLTVEEFLAAEPHYTEKHEYLGGMVYAMAGASTPHNIISTNLITALGSRLRGRPCQVFGADMKLRLLLSSSTYFYYPDAMIVCHSAGLGDSWCDEPSVIFEILSESTRTIDEREKRIAYLSLASLDAYVLIEQERREVVIERREAGSWRRDVLGADGVLRLPTVEVEIPVGELYERLEVA